MAGKMEKTLLTLAGAAACSAWNYSGHRLSAGYSDGSASVFDAVCPGSPLSSTFSWKVCEGGSDGGVLKVVWVPPEYGDALACVCADGSVSLWEEVQEDSEPLKWVLCKRFEEGFRVLDLQFGASTENLKMVAAYSDGLVKVYELLDPLDLSKWQLQAEFQNVLDPISRLQKPTCSSASIAWNTQRGVNPTSSFALGYNSETASFNSCKVWEFDEAHQRWLPVAELGLPEDKGDPVYALAWAPNIGRPYEIVAVATCKGITIWHLELNSDGDGRVSVDRAASLSGHNGEVWQLDWDMSGMTLASVGSDNAVRLWQANLNGVWQEKATLESN